MGNITSSVIGFIKSIWKRGDDNIEKASGDISALEGNMDMGTAAMVASGNMGAMQQYLGLDNDLLSRFVDYEEMDEYPDCSTTLDIHADDATIVDNRENKTLWVSCADEEIRKSLDDVFNKKIKADEISWSDIRTLCKYGNCYDYILLDESGVVGLRNMPPSTMTRVEGDHSSNVGFMQSFSTNYEVDYNYFKEGKHWNNGVASSGGVNLFRDWRMVHMRLRSKTASSLYGYSILESSRYIWKRLVLLEDAALIYRLTRSPSRFGFYIDVGKTPPKKAEAILNKFKQKMKKKKFVNPKTGKLDLRYNPLGANEDFFLPIHDGKEKVRVDTLNSPSWQAMDDIEYFRNKLHAALSVPRAYLGYDENQPSRATLSQESVRFARKVLRIQREYRNGMRKVAEVHLACNRIDPIHVDFDIQMSAPNSIFEIAQLEVEQARSSFARDMDEYVSKYWILSKIFNLSDKEISSIMDQRKNDAVRRAEMEAEADKVRDGGGGGGRRFASKEYDLEKSLIEGGNREHEKRLEGKIDKIMESNGELGGRMRNLNKLLQELKFYKRAS